MFDNSEFIIAGGNFQWWNYQFSFNEDITSHLEISIKVIFYLFQFGIV